MSDFPCGDLACGEFAVFIVGTTSSFNNTVSLRIVDLPEHHLMVETLVTFIL